MIDYSKEFLKLQNKFDNKVNILNKKFAEQIAEFKVHDIIKQNNCIMFVEEISAVCDYNNYFEKVLYKGKKIKRVKDKIYTITSIDTASGGWFDDKPIKKIDIEIIS